MNDENTETPQCVICGDAIKPQANGWAHGHNAAPVRDGQCCDVCNYAVVIPARIGGAAISDHYPVSVLTPGYPAMPPEAIFKNQPWAIGDYLPTREQSASLVRVFEQHVRDTDHAGFVNTGFLDWIERDVIKLHYDDCLLAAVPDMFIGIERDGYSHT